MIGTCAGDQSQVRGHGKWSPKGLVSSPVMPPSGGDRREPQRLDLWQSPPPASGSWREEANDAGAFHVVSGPAFPDGSYGSQWWEKDPECPRRWPRTAPPGRTPPNPPGTELPGPGDGSLEFLHSVHLLAVYDDGGGSVVLSLLLVLRSSRTTSGLKQRHMKGGWDTIIRW